MKSIFGMCFNWKVLAGLAFVGVGLLVVAPGVFIGALPLLLLAACPLSMMLMMRGGHGHGQAHAQAVDGVPQREQTRESLEQRLAALHQEEHSVQGELRRREADALARPEDGALDVAAGNARG